MMNFDMVGQGDGGCDDRPGFELLGDIGWELGGLAGATCEANRSSMDQDGDASQRLCDRSWKQGAPGVAFWSSGSHPFYHH
jgi:hypothetical protein